MLSRRFITFRNGQRMTLADPRIHNKDLIEIRHRFPKDFKYVESRDHLTIEGMKVAISCEKKETLLNLVTRDEVPVNVYMKHLYQQKDIDQILEARTTTVSELVKHKEHDKLVQKSEPLQIIGPGNVWETLDIKVDQRQIMNQKTFAQSRHFVSQICGIFGACCYGSLVHDLITQKPTLSVFKVNKYAMWITFAFSGITALGCYFLARNDVFSISKIKGLVPVTVFFLGIYVTTGLGGFVGTVMGMNHVTN